MENESNKKLSQRLNLRITDENYKYLKIMCGLTGDTYSGLINRVLDNDRAAKADIYQKALKITNEYRLPEYGKKRWANSIDKGEK